MKRKIVIGMLVLSMAVSATACSSKKEETAKIETSQTETSQSTDTEKSSDTTDEADSSDERNAYGLTEEETAKLAELVKEKVKTQYLDKYEIDPASFTFPEYEPVGEENRAEAADPWTFVDWNCLRISELGLHVITAEFAGDKSYGIDGIAEGISDGEISFKESMQEQNELGYEWYAENDPQKGDLIGAIYEGIAEFLNGLDDAERAEVLYDVYAANVYQDGNGEDEQGRTLHSMFDQVIIENVSFK